MIRRLARDGRDAGISLPELAVTMMIMAIVITAATAIFVSTTRQFRATDGATSTQADSRILLESITRDIRVAVTDPNGRSAFAAAEPARLTFYTSKGAGEGHPIQVTYTVDQKSQCLRRTQVTPQGYVNPQYPPRNQTSRCVTHSRVATDQPVFTYRELDGTATTDLERIAAVDIRFSLTSPDRSEVRPTVVTRSVTTINQSNRILRGQE